jgi:hypothetical protein
VSASRERPPRRWSRGELAVAGTFAILVAAMAAFVLGLAGLKCNGESNLLVCDHPWDTVNAVLVVASGGLVSGGAAMSVWMQRALPLGIGVAVAFLGFAASAVIGGLHQ